MVDPLDLRRLTELRELDGMSAEAWQEMVEDLIDSLTGVVDRVISTVKRGELDAAAQAAHLGRNDALMFGSGALARVLGAVEQAGRSGDRARAQEGLVSLQALWPETRAALESVRAAHP